jgi:hypothetical protein
LDLGKEPTIDLSFLAGLGKSLRQFALVPSSGIYFSRPEIGMLLKQAPNLEDLAINLCFVDLGHVQSLGAKFKLPAPGKDEPLLGELVYILVSQISLK